MEQIYENLATPAWWFTGLFFLCIGIALNWSYRHIPNRFRIFSRNRKAKNLKRIRHIRWHQSEINYEISKTTGRFLLFCLLSLTFLGWLAYEPVIKLIEFNKYLAFAFTTPIYIMEILWLNQDSKVKEVIKLRKKLHI